MGEVDELTVINNDERKMGIREDATRLDMVRADGERVETL